MLLHSLSDAWLFLAQTSSTLKRTDIFLFRQRIVNNVHALLSHRKVFKAAVHVFQNAGKM